MVCFRSQTGPNSPLSAKVVPYFVQHEEIVIGIYNFFQYSAVRYNKLKELKNLLNQKVKRFKKPMQVCWLSTCEAVKAIYSAWTLLILSLKHEAAANNSEGAAKARWWSVSWKWRSQVLLTSKTKNNIVFIASTVLAFFLMSLD